MYIMTHRKLCQGPTPMLTVDIVIKKQKHKKKKKKKGKTIIYRLAGNGRSGKR